MLGIGNGRGAGTKSSSRTNTAEYCHTRGIRRSITVDTPPEIWKAPDDSPRPESGRRSTPQACAYACLYRVESEGWRGENQHRREPAAALAEAGLNVLVIDNDPQGNASTALGIEHGVDAPSVYNVLIEDKPLAKIVQECPDMPGLFCAPANIDLCGC